MYILKEYEDGGKSWAFETGDVVILQRSVVVRDLYGHTIRTYKPGDEVTITGRRDRGGSSAVLLPKMLSFYQFNNEILESQMDSAFKPKDETLAKPAPKAFVVPWHEGRMNKWSLVAARTPEEAVEFCFAAKYFTEERMKGITIGEVFERNDWELPEGERWISIQPLR